MARGGSVGTGGYPQLESFRLALGMAVVLVAASCRAIRPYMHGLGSIPGAYGKHSAS